MKKVGIKAALVRTRQAIAWQPLTFRGFLALSLSAIAIKYLAIDRADLVVSTLCGGVAALLAIVLIACSIARVRYARRIAAEIHFDSGHAFSRQEIPAGIILTGSTVLPYFSLSVERIFIQAGARSPTHLIRGKDQNNKRHLIDSVVFPHRGLWTLGHLRFTLRDNLGFTSLHWSLPVESSVEVQARTIPIRPLPIVAASSRSGDQLHQTRERAGDPFDIKPYDPSDGIKRILWKTFARSGELVVRRPEPAIVPEGEVALYLIAGKEDDYVAGTAQHYIAHLDENEITVLFGTDGALFESLGSPVTTDPAARGALYCSDLDEISHAITYTVWDKRAGSGKGFQDYLESLAVGQKSVQNVVLFAPANSLSWVKAVAQASHMHSVKLSIALVPKEIDFSLAAAFANHQARSLDGFRSFLPWGKRPTGSEHIAPGSGIPDLAALGAEVLNVEAYE